ncbi:MAG: DNA-J related domain-containing protein [Thalassolituus sp.]
MTDDIELITDLLGGYLHDGRQCSEYDLIRWLQEPGQAVFDKDALSDNLMLFRANFLVMHCLYRLQQRWVADDTGYLEVSALKVQLRTTANDSSKAQNLAEHDVMAEYYLNLSNIDTDSEAVDALLNDFWKRMVQPEHLDADLAVLELSLPVSSQELKQQYRRLASEHHPDKGGDASRFREISSAYQRLR